MIYIVGNHFFRKQLEKHPQFEMDLGRKYSEKTPDGLEINIQDLFVVDFYQKNLELIYKVGRLGSINIYTSSKLTDDQIIVNRDNKYHNLSYNTTNLQLNLEQELASILLSTEPKSDESEEVAQ